MSSIADRAPGGAGEGGFGASGDRLAFLAIIGAVWVGVLSGFGTDSVRHVQAHGLDYPLIVHVHAVTYVAWLCLFTAQIWLIRRGRADLHRRLGQWGAVMAALMVVLGPATAIVVDARRFALSGASPEFAIVQLTGVFGFAVLTGAGLWLRRRAADHKRLMVLGVISLGSAGFARFLNDVLIGVFGWRFDVVPGRFMHLYFCDMILLVAMALYDLGSRRRLNLAWSLGALVIIAQEAASAVLLYSPAWKALSFRLIGR
jgi:hypothetical protein